MIRIGLSSHITLQGHPPHLEQALKQTLSFPNPKWIENNRMGRWNKNTPRVLKFFKKGKGDRLYLPKGFMRSLLVMCKTHGLDYEINDKRRMLSPVSLEFSGTLRPFQETCVNAMLKRDFGTVCAPTGSGKTCMALFMAAQRKQPTLIVVHTQELARQWVERIQTFLSLEEKQVGVIGMGKLRVGDRITVALVQSLYKSADKVAKKIGFLVVDECHRCPSRTFTQAVRAFDAKYMLGLSATPYRRDKLSRLIFWHLGDIHFRVEPHELVETGHVLPVEVKVRKTDFSPYYDPVLEYGKMLREMVADKDRNHLIAADVAQEVKSRPGICLVLSDRKIHCETLQTLLRFTHKIEAELLTGDLAPNERKAVLSRVKDGETRVLVATGQLIGEGFDCPSLTTLFMATPVRFMGRVIQYAGRVLRPAPGKAKARIFDYVDENVPSLVAAADKRLKIYGSMAEKIKN